MNSQDTDFMKYWISNHNPLDNDPKKLTEILGKMDIPTPITDITQSEKLESITDITHSENIAPEGYDNVPVPQKSYLQSGMGNQHRQIEMVVARHIDDIFGQFCANNEVKVCPDKDRYVVWASPIQLSPPNTQSCPTLQTVHCEMQEYFVSTTISDLSMMHDEVGLKYMCEKLEYLMLNKLETARACNDYMAVTKPKVRIDYNPLHMETIIRVGFCIGTTNA